MKDKQNDLYWSFSLYGTAIGAGVLFLPIAIGVLGIIPALIIFIFTFPLVFFPHRSLCRFVISDSNKDADATAVADKYFSKKGSFLFNLLYLFCILPILLIYSAGIVNTLIDFLNYQLNYSVQYRFIVCLIIISILILLVSFGKKFIARIMSIIVVPFIIVLLILSLWMIQYWDFAIIQQSINHNNNFKGIILSIFVAIPIIIFSFNHSPIISSLAVHVKNKYDDDIDKKASKIIAISNMLMIFTVVLFTLSTLFSLTPADFISAKEQNISILSYLADHSKNAFLRYTTPIIAFIAMSKSFFGHYLGVREGIMSILSKITHPTDEKKRSKITLLITFFACLAVSYLNPNILNIISVILGPFLIVLLFFIPTYSMYKIKQMSKYRNKYIDLFITSIGIITIFVVLYQFIS
jgi:serine transporter